MLLGLFLGLRFCLYSWHLTLSRSGKKSGDLTGGFGPFRWKLGLWASKNPSADVCHVYCWETNPQVIRGTGVNLDLSSLLVASPAP
jgi:hypothetical protein